MLSGRGFIFISSLNDKEVPTTIPNKLATHE